jgi:8-oxo-dGTP pyrophosphatase MutT (NUDIX family)
MAQSNKDTLSWREENRTVLQDYRVFRVSESLCLGPENSEKAFVVLEANDWAIVAPVYTESDGSLSCVMVRQWRPGEGGLSLEFPGGVIEKGEAPAIGAARELREETGMEADELVHLATINPNPAISANHVHIFMAKGLRKVSDQHLDVDEYVSIENVPLNDVVAGMGKPPYVHGLMHAALLLLLRECGLIQAS